MKYIIMAAGKGKRWNNYLGITKQEICIDNERLLDRIVRQIKQRTNDEVLILSGNKKHENKDAIRIISKYNDYFHSKYAYDFLNQETTYLYGDTFYDDMAIDIIVNTPTNNIAFFGNENAIIGIKVKNFELLRNVLDDQNDSNKSLYHAFDKLDEYREFINVGDTFLNINDSNDYKKIIDKQKKLKLK